ncbi:bifunctional oligoribonuclease/PAP phosphatase NrnA [Paenibacillus aurantius]|uniref:Bifunctional oligoribonuclease/PAP phosphatase NrnA n=1 Tax=Paenibacillus aurantius TaxID=2918900 RepID=A0AA96LH65_9BACL|nr:bifunctional oligoribonuclease/PAP phosphatase NrnA [Paenibacillus aurantius]WNQ13776.1 bifunctional oligoribonuclease/PAP phosphatase NrnA [Paenibacillus aurantius]
MKPERPSYDWQLQEAKRFLEEQDDFLVVAHINPDGDAISSTLAVGWMLKQLGKRFVMVNEGKSPDKFDYLWGNSDIADFSVIERKPDFQHVISVDCADYSRIGQVSSIFGEAPSLLNIDHHPTNDYFGTVQLIRPDAAATVEILYELAVVLGIRWEEELASCIYTGLLTDTGGFRYSNTTPNVMRIASEMLGYGVKGSVLAEHLLERMTRSHVALLRKALAQLSFSHEGKIAWIAVSAQDIAEAGASNEDLEGIVNYPRNIEGVEVGILVKEGEGGRFKASLRSAGKVNVAEIAQRFGGGGHVRAAGCSFEGTIESVLDKIVKEVGKALV